MSFFVWLAVMGISSHLSISLSFPLKFPLIFGRVLLNPTAWSQKTCLKDEYVLTTYETSAKKSLIAPRREQPEEEKKPEIRWNSNGLSCRLVAPYLLNCTVGQASHRAVRLACVHKLQLTCCRAIIT